MAVIPVSTPTFLNCTSTFTWWKQCQIKAKCFRLFTFVMFHYLFILFYYQSHFFMSTERCTIHNWSGYSTNMKCAIQINYLGPSCNRRHVRHSWPGVRRWVDGGGGSGLGGWVFERFFLVHKTGLWKTCLGGRAITDTILFMCLLKGLYLRHLSLSHWFIWPKFISYACLKCGIWVMQLKKIEASVC